MRFRDAIKKVLKDKKITQTALAEKLGYSHQSAVAMPIMKDNITLSVLLEWLDVLDYELVIKPKKGAGRRKEGEYVIERVTDGE
jgi:transcriptional regulator with XRE-family HTH domain